MKGKQFDENSIIFILKNQV